MITRVLSENQRIQDIIPWHYGEEPSVVAVAAPSVQKILALRALNDGPSIGQYSHSVKKEISLDKKDGTLYEFGNYSVWKISISSIDAKSMNFHFSQLNLPNRSQMYIYNGENNVILGPVASENVSNNKFASDIVFGDKVTIEIVFYDDDYDRFEIEIAQLFYGFNNSTASYGLAQGCIPDIVCPEGNGWQVEAASVCLILNSSGEVCSGSLVTDDCYTGTPYILSASHCLENQDVSNWVFRFRYRNVDCGGTEVPFEFSWKSFSGSTLISSWEDSDFALVELSEEVEAEDEVVFAGWIRLDNIPTEITTIHHPRGDAMKISRDANSPTVNTTPINFTGSTTNFTVATGNAYEMVHDNGNGGDFGILEPGSSGAPLFDQNNRIVGIVSGGVADVCTNPNNSFGGRFFSSWVGGGTNSTELQNWLGGTLNSTTTNSNGIPFISGEEVVCDSPDTYTLENAPPGYSVSWTVTPASLFSGSSGGSGSSVNLEAANSFVSGSATLTFSMTNGACGSRTVTRNLWVGKPSIPSISAPNCFEPGVNYTISVNSQGGESYSWNLPNCPFLPFDPERCWEN